MLQCIFVICIFTVETVQSWVVERVCSVHNLVLGATAALSLVHIVQWTLHWCVSGLHCAHCPLQWCESGWEGGCYSVQCDHYTCDQHCACTLVFNFSLQWCELSGWECGGGNSSLFLRRLCPAVHTDKTLGGKGEWFEYLKCLHHNHRFNHRTKHG